MPDRPSSRAKEPCQQRRKAPSRAKDNAEAARAQRTAESERAEEAVEERGKVAEAPEVRVRKGRDRPSQGLDSASARLLHQRDSLGRGFEAHAASILGGVTPHETGALQAGDDAAHRRRANLLGVRKFPERFGSTEDEDGKGGELRGTDSAGEIADAQAAQQVDRGRMQLVSDRERVRRNSGLELADLVGCVFRFHVSDFSFFLLTPAPQYS